MTVSNTYENHCLEVHTPVPLKRKVANQNIAIQKRMIATDGSTAHLCPSTLSAQARILQLINYNSNQSGVKVLYFNENFHRRPSSTSYLEAETELEIFHIPNFDELPTSFSEMGQPNVSEINVVHSRVPQLQQAEIVTVRTSSFKRAWKGIKNAFTFKRCRH